MNSESMQKSRGHSYYERMSAQDSAHCRKSMNLRERGKHVAESRYFEDFLSFGTQLSTGEDLTRKLVLPFVFWSSRQRFDLRYLSQGVTCHFLTCSSELLAQHWSCKRPRSWVQRTEAPLPNAYHRMAGDIYISKNWLQLKEVYIHIPRTT